MFLYTILAALFGIAMGLVLSARTKKKKDLRYGRLDRVGAVTNVVLLVLYACAAPFCMFLGFVSEPRLDGFLGLVGRLVVIIIASSSLFSALGLGLSVDLRKKGRSKLSFAVQFAGAAGIALTALLYCVFEGNLLAALN